MNLLAFPDNQNIAILENYMDALKDTEKGIEFKTVSSMFAVDHGNVTKVYLFDDEFQHIAYAFYGAGKAPVIEKKATNTKAADLGQVLDKQMIQGGRGVAMIDKERRKLLVYNFCSHS